MQVLCKSTIGRGEATCCVCGQGFIFFWERQSRAERAQTIVEIQRTLINHHRTTPGPLAHPHGGFVVAQSEGPVAFSGAAVPGHPPTWAL